ncbi:hypothetical protein GGE24_007247 [Bradyrhizobium centrosematis]|nr:hypothetical protein [Bradyrhizobium centrosematis]MCS3777872.1 hypothetical protein [Bradyrhizobium centrosematis]
MDRSYVKGRDRDRINAVLARIGQNIGPLRDG